MTLSVLTYRLCVARSRCNAIASLNVHAAAAIRGKGFSCLAFEAQGRDRAPSSSADPFERPAGSEGADDERDLVPRFSRFRRDGANKLARPRQDTSFTVATFTSRLGKNPAVVARSNRRGPTNSKDDFRAYRRMGWGRRLG